MYHALGEKRLKNGERLAVGVVECPDADWAGRVVPFLGHKRAETREQIRRGLEGPLDGLETRYYVGCLDGELVTEVMIVSARGTGILGHVYTLPDHRRKGAYSALMAHQMADVERIGVRVLTLSTGFEGAPYWIYHSFGFRRIAPRYGHMVWRRRPEDESELFSPGEVTVRPARWDDWPWFDLLGMQPVGPDECLPRAALLELRSCGSLEGAFTAFQLEREREPARQAVVLESERGATVGFAVCAPDARWFGDAWVADLYLHPVFRYHANRLLAALKWPAGPCIAYRAPGGDRFTEDAAWSAAGFAKLATLPAWLAVGDGRRDLELWVRSG